MMLKRLKYAWLQILLAAAVACGTSACVIERFPDDDGLHGNPNAVNLILTMQMPAGITGTRAAETLTAEELRELRVVIVSLPVDSSGNRVSDEEPVVEFNELLTNVVLNTMGQRELMFEDVIPDRQKRIYFLANCENSSSSYLDIRDGNGTPIELTAPAAYIPVGGHAPIDDAVFTAPAGRYGDTYTYGIEQRITDYHVPVTAVHELTVPTLDVLRKLAHPGRQWTYEIQNPLYLVRAVNKINVTIVNNTGALSSKNDGTFFIPPTDVRLVSFSITKISKGKSYLFAHLDEEDELFKSYRLPASELEKPAYARADLNPAWMRWLADEARKSQNENYRAYQWLTSYELPETDNVVSRLFDFEDIAQWTSSSNTDGGNTEWTAPAVYFPETIYIPAEDSDDDESDEAEGVAAGGEQQYVLTCNFEQQASDGSVKNTEYSAVLPNLESLFRNTHVKVRLSITDNADVQLDLVVLPWTLAPEEEWHYSRIPTVTENGFITWENASYDSQEDPEATSTTDYRLVLKENGSAAVGTFMISSPVNDEWYAYLIPLTGNPDAFMFVDEMGKEITNPHGIIDGSNSATIRVCQRNAVTAEQNAAKLQIMVRTADNRFLEADVCKGDPTYYTIIQNRNEY